MADPLDDIAVSLRHIAYSLGGINHKLHEQKNLLVGISRALDRLMGKRGGVQQNETETKEN